MDKEQRYRAKEQVVFLMREGTSWKEATTRVGIQVGRATAYRWLAAWRAHGAIAFQDGRHGHLAKLREPVRTTLETMCRQAPEMPSKEVQAALQHQFGISVSIGHLNRVRAQLSIGNHVGRLKKNNNCSVLHRKLSGKTGLLKSRGEVKKTSQSGRMKRLKTRFRQERLVMDYTTLLPEVKEAKEQSHKQVQSLYGLCQHLVDGRAARGKRYDLAGLLAVLVIAKLAGMKSLLGASEWIKHQEEVLREGLPLSWKRMPCANTYSYVLARLDSQQINATLAAWFVRTAAENRKEEDPRCEKNVPHEHLAIDGKALKGTGSQAYGGQDPQQHVLHVYEVQTGIVLHQCPIGEKRNEVSALKPLLTEVVCKGRILTVDAAQSYHEFGRLVQQAGGDVIIIVKDNTPVTRADLELFFEDPQADTTTWRSSTQFEKGHGRLERRTIFTRPDLNDFLYRDWGDVGQVFRLQRERTCKGTHTVEVIYGWTSLFPKQCSPERLLGLIRAHWAVENRLHWRRDATLGEDRCGVRLDPVAVMLAVLNTLVLSLMDLHQVTNVASQLRRFSAHPREAMAWLLPAHDF